MDLKRLSMFRCKLQQKVTEFHSGNFMWSSRKYNRCRYGGLPAGIYNTGTLEWFTRGLMNSTDDLPSRTWSTGAREWHSCGNRHREHNRPAIIMRNTQVWYYNNIHYKPGSKPAVFSKEISEEFWLLSID